MALTVSLLLVALVGLIRAQPPDDANLQSFLSLDACALPCFMGIRPGLTNTQEAIRLLEQHEWVEKVTHHIWFGGPNRSTYSWSWSGFQPALLNYTAPGVFTTNGNIVDMLQVSTMISLGDFWLLGQPERSLLAHEPGQLTYRAIYLNGALQIETTPVCPLNLADFWRAPVQMILSSDTQPDPAALQLPDWLENTPCP
jgi:hypothetical protein